ncbi:hypothetical protein PIROE2DRAFT_17640, partial [Piromyces sp. E2]
KKKFSDLLVLLDQHAIDERIQLELLLHQYKHGNSKGNGPEITQLTPPIRIILPNHEIKRICEFKQEFKDIGIYFVEDDFKYSYYGGDDRELTYSEQEIIENYGSGYFDKDHHLKSNFFRLFNQDSILDRNNENDIQKKDMGEEEEAFSGVNPSRASQANQLFSALSIIRVIKLPRLIVERCLTNVEKLTHIIRNCLYELENSSSKYKNSHPLSEEGSSSSSSHSTNFHSKPPKATQFFSKQQHSLSAETNTSSYFRNKDSGLNDHTITIQSFHFSDRKVDFIPSSIYSILCSLACHKAKKFDDPLSLKECRDIVEQMPSLQFPFQCAHGRPTMIPLINLTFLKKLSSFSHNSYSQECQSLLLQKYKRKRKKEIK